MSNETGFKSAARVGGGLPMSGASILMQSTPLRPKG